MRSDWERMRMLATITIQPHVKKKLTPKALLLFEWDDQKRKEEHPTVSKEEDQQRLDKLLKRRKG
jgi:hypothetical protein